MSITSLPLSLTGIPDNLCFEGTFAEAIQSVLAAVRVLIPSNITNVVVGAVEPSDSQRDYVWFRLNNGGDFEGVFIYAAGDWQQVFPQPNGLFWVYGNPDYPDSTTPPPGYLPANDADSPLTAPEKTHLETLWYPPGPVGPWTIYQALFVGF